MKAPQPLSLKQQPPFDAKAALRLLSRVLDDEAYDHPNQRYKPGFSDSSLAKDIGLSEKAVATERERLCGPVGESPEVARLRDEFATLKQAADDMNIQLTSLRQDITTSSQRLAVFAQKPL